MELENKKPRWEQRVSTLSFFLTEKGYLLTPTKGVVCKLIKVHFIDLYNEYCDIMVKYHKRLTLRKSDLKSHLYLLGFTCGNISINGKTRAGCVFYKEIEGEKSVEINGEQWCSLENICEALGYSKSTAYDKVKSGEVMKRRFEGRVYFKIREVKYGNN